MANKSSHRPIRTIKTPFNLLLLGVFVIMGVFFTNQAILGQTPFEDDFESYATGTLSENWGSCGGFMPEVVDTKSYNEFQSIYFSYRDLVAEDCITRTTIGENIFDGNIKLWFYYEIDGSTELCWESQFFSLPSQVVWLGFRASSTCEIVFGTKTDTILLADLIYDDWFNIVVEWKNNIIDDDEFRINFNDEGFGNWNYTTYNIGASGINNIRLKTAKRTKSYVDYITSGEINCSDFGGWYSCRNAGCCFSYFPVWSGIYGGMCGDCPTGECGSGPYDCQNCLTISTCEAEVNCYWFSPENGNGFCKFGTGVCGEGLELVLCDNQNDCENAGGYWYDDFCWLSPQTTLTSWEDYYNEYGDYETPSAWISNMASTTYVFLGQMGGFITTFENNFDLRVAFERGKNFGQVIPMARGYLTIFDNFLGGFPIGEFFVFLLIFMIAVGVFRIMRNLFQLIKFW